MKKKWIAVVSVCLCLVAVGVLYTKGPEESPAPPSPEAKQTEQPVKEPDKQPEKEKPVLEIEPAAFSPEEQQHYAWQQWQFDYACPSGWESRPMEVWEASENQEASPEWGVELVPSAGKGGMGHSSSGFPPESEFGRALAGECGDLLRR